MINKILLNIKIQKGFFLFVELKLIIILKNKSHIFFSYWINKTKWKICKFFFSIYLRIISKLLANLLSIYFKMKFYKREKKKRIIKAN